MGMLSCFPLFGGFVTEPWTWKRVHYVPRTGLAAEIRLVRLASSPHQKKKHSPLAKHLKFPTIIIYCILLLYFVTRDCVESYSKILVVVPHSSV